MSLSAKNFKISFFYYMKIYRIKISHISQNFTKPSYVKAWKAWFKVLKQDLSVCLSPFDTNFSFIGIIHSKLQEESVSLKISGLTAIVSRIFVLLGIG